MTNYERIKNMTVEEMAAAINKGIPDCACDYCPFNDMSTTCYDNFCEEHSEVEIIQMWLESEAEE